MAAIHLSAHVDMCAKAFLSFISALTNTPRFASQISPQTVTNEFDRFKIWVGNIAAHRKGRRSLEYRLRDAIHLKDETQNLLISLQSSLIDALSIVQGSKVPWDELSDSDSDSEPDLDPSASADSRSQGLQGDTELKQISASVKNTVTCLFRLSMVIRDPAPDSQLKSTITIDKSYYESHDVQHVQAKFGRDDFLTKRLGRAISGRRQYLAYREEHHRKLSKNVEKLGFEEPKTEYTTNSTEATPIPNTQRDNTSTDNASEALVLDDGEDTLSRTSYATSVNATIRIPRLPKEALEQEHFECPFCYMIVSIQTTAAWKQHVYRDLHPYSCTFEQCATADRLYDSRRAWWKHELEAHRTSWQCIDGCEKDFTTEVSFTAHVQQVHPDLAEDTLLSALKRTAVRSASLTDCARCPLCGVETSLRILQKHLGAHQEQLALFVLPPNLDATEDDVDDEKSPIEGAKSNNEVAEFSASDGADSVDEDPVDIKNKYAEEKLQSEKREELLKKRIELKYLKDQQERDEEEARIKEEEERLKKEWELKQEIEERKRLERSKEAEDERKRIIMENTIKLEKAEREAKAERQAAVDAYNKERDEKEAKAKAERERVIMEYERKKVQDKVKAEQQRKELILQLNIEEEEAKRKEEEEWERFKEKQQKKEDEDKAKKKKQEDELEDQMRKRLAHFGFQENQIQAMIKPEEQEKLQLLQQQGMAPLNPLRLTQQPTYVKVHKEHLAVDTLLYYDIPYEIDRGDPNYLIILREMDSKETEILFEHSRRVRSRQVHSRQVHNPLRKLVNIRRRHSAGERPHHGTSLETKFQFSELQWPESVQDYIRRAFDINNSVPGISQQDIASKLNETLRYYRGSETLDQVDWLKYPLPQDILLKAEATQEGSLVSEPNKQIRSEDPQTYSRFVQPTKRAISPNPPHSRDDRGPEFSIFVGDLGPEVTEFVLVSLFQNKYASCKSAKIMSDPISGMSRGYGFVRFSSEQDQQNALSEMQGVYCGNRPMRISTATPKNKSGGPGGPMLPTDVFEREENIDAHMPVEKDFSANIIIAENDIEDHFDSDRELQTRQAWHDLRARRELKEEKRLEDLRRKSEQQELYSSQTYGEHDGVSDASDTSQRVGEHNRPTDISPVIDDSTGSSQDTYLRPSSTVTEILSTKDARDEYDRNGLLASRAEFSKERYAPRASSPPAAVPAFGFSNVWRNPALDTKSASATQAQTPGMPEHDEQRGKHPKSEDVRGRLSVRPPTASRTTSLNPADHLRFGEEFSRPSATTRGHSSPPISPQFQPVNMQAEDSIEDISLNSDIRKPAQSCARCLKVEEPCSGDPGDGSGCEECKLLRIPSRCTFGPNRGLSGVVTVPGTSSNKGDIESTLTRIPWDQWVQNKSPRDDDSNDDHISRKE